MSNPELPIPTTIVLFRQDLRLDDHPPLAYAAGRGRVVPVYIQDITSTTRAIGGASKWWLHHSLELLSVSLTNIGSPLIICQGDPVKVLATLCNQVGADQVCLHESVDPQVQATDDQLDEQLAGLSIELVRFNQPLLWPIGSVLTGSAQPYKVFTPFWNRAKSIPVESPIDAPYSIKPPLQTPA